MNTQAQDSTQSVARRRAVSTLATRRGFALASLALLGLLASPWAARPARAQSVFEKLLEAARARMSTLVPGIGALPGVGELGVAAPHYVAGVLQQVLQRADPAQVSGPKLLSPVAGTATLQIEIGPGGQLLGVKVSATSGQGQALAGRALDSVRRAAPFQVPVMADGGPPKRVIVEETWVFDAWQRWQLEPVLERSKRDYENAA